MARNIQVLDVKPKGGIVLDTKPRNSLVLDLKPHEKVYGETAWTAVDLAQGASIGPGWYMYVTYPQYILNRI